MIFRVVASINVEARPGQIDVAFVPRAGGIVSHDAGFVFERRDTVDVVDGRNGIAPGQTTIYGCFDEDPIFSAWWSWCADANKRQVRMINRAVAAEGDHVVALR